jgi:tight adherence protein B
MLESIITSRERQLALKRAEKLLDLQPNSSQFINYSKQNYACPPCKSEPRDYISELIYFSGLTLPTWTIYISSILIAFALAFLSSKLISLYFVPIYLIGGALIPIAWLEAKSSKRAKEFAADYPIVLLAMASSLKVGMPPLQALERAIRLLPKESVVKKEISHLLVAFNRGTSKQQVVRIFAASINLPDIELFRSAFLLVLDNGGRFAPTLDRLATVSRDRTTLIKSAFVTTASMRMTANFLLAASPFLLFVVSMRFENFWPLLLEHPTANFIGSLGIVLITVGYLTLRIMSSFKP